IVKGTWMVFGIKQIKHTIGGSTCLLHSRVPLTDDTRAARQTIGRLKNISSSIDIGRTGMHSTINLDTTSTGNTTAFDEINNWLDTNGNDHHFTGDMCPLRSHNSCNLPLFASN